MSTLSIPGGSFNDSLHEYRDDKGVWVPSLTQIISLCGLSNGYGGAAPEVLQNAARRGSEIHWLACSWARYGDVDPSLVTEEVLPYFESYKKFLSETGFVPDPDWIESPMVATVNGLSFGVTADVIGVRKPTPTVVELKTTAAESKAWSVQTMGQAIGRFGLHGAGQAKRMVVQLKNDGKYRCFVYENYAYDCSIFLAALSLVHWRLKHGQRLWEVA